MRQLLFSVSLLSFLILSWNQSALTASEFHLDGDYLIGGLFDIHYVSDFVYFRKPEALDCSKDQSSGHKIIALVGPFTSTDTLAVTPQFMPDLIPVVSYGAASSVLSQKHRFPSFLRTVHSNKEVIDVMVSIVQNFHWRWVAFLHTDNDFGIDGLELFRRRIKSTDICLAYTKGLDVNTNYSQVFKQIEAQKINVIIVFSTNMDGEALIKSAIELNIRNKVWLTGDTWSLNKKLRKMGGIKDIGTVLGVSQPVIIIPGFSDFIYSTKSQRPFDSTEQKTFCNQDCNCSSLSAEDIVSMDPSFSFPVYSAVYAIAHALHNVLQCGADKCNGNVKVYPFMILKELRKSNFTLLNISVQFTEDGNPKFGHYSIVFWSQSGDAEEVGFYRFFPSVSFFINTSKIQWYTNKEVPISLCSPECPAGYQKMQNSIHKCCFGCKMCPNGTYCNSAEDPYRCIPCQDS
ncbi:unnamed protein product, partial [Menidia menidia]